MHAGVTATPVSRQDRREGTTPRYEAPISRTRLCRADRNMSRDISVRRFSGWKYRSARAIDTAVKSAALMTLSA